MVLVSISFASQQSKKKTPQFCGENGGDVLNFEDPIEISVASTPKIVNTYAGVMVMAFWAVERCGRLE